MAVRFELSTSVTLVGKDLQFIGLENDARIRFVVTNDALKRLAGSVKELSSQQKFKAYDKNRAWLQNVAVQLFARGPQTAKTIKITVADLTV
jgi:hypothetical protein